MILDRIREISKRTSTIYEAIQEMTQTLSSFTEQDIRELSQEELDTLEYMVIFIDDIK
jgi:hypothetical protein